MAYTEEDLADLDFTGSAGGDAAEEIEKRQAEERAKRRIQFDRIEYFGIKDDGGTATFRFLNDYTSRPGEVTPAWITALTHSYVPTKPQPLNYRGKSWPATRGAVCRKDQIFAAKYNNTCEIDEIIHTSGYNKGKKCFASPKTYAFVVMREEVIGTQEMVATGEIAEHQVGKVLYLRDRMKEVAVVGADGKPVEGKTQLVPDIRIVEQSWENFFGILFGMAGLWDTILDRDIRCTRKGTDTDTKYRFAAMDPFDVTMPDGSVRRYDLRDSEIFHAKYPNMPSLKLHLARLASDDYYKRFFIGPQDDDAKDGDAPSNGRAATAEPTARPAAPSGDANQAAKLAEMQKRVMQYANPVGAPAAAPATPASTPRPL